MPEQNKHEHHEDERTLKHDPNLKGAVEQESIPQGEEWPESALTDSNTGDKNPKATSTAAARPQPVTTPEEKLSHVTPVERGNGKGETDGFVGA